MLSVVVTTFNRRDLLARCLRSLANQDCGDSEFEVIVVVDGSTDGTQEFLRTFAFGPHLTVIDQPNLGLAAARNAGIRRAKHEIIMFLDDDLLCSPKVVSEHLKAHRLKEDIVAFGPILLASAKSADVPTRVTRRYYADAVYGPLHGGESPTWPVHARVPPNSSMRTQLLTSFGGFDETFVNAHEDIELGIRLWQSGVPFKYLPSADVEHIYEKSYKQLATTEAYLGGRNDVKLSRKHATYRPISALARIQERRLFRSGIAESLVKSDFLYRVSQAALSTAQVLRFKQDLLFGIKTNINMQRSGLCEAGSWESYKAEFCVRLPVLLYHHIGEPTNAPYADLTVDPDSFSAQMNWLSENGYTPIRPCDWHDWRESARPLPARPILITFDDAYADLEENVFPVLKRLRFPAVVFVPTSFVGQTNGWNQPMGTPVIPIMGKEAISRWAREGIEFGGHSRTHWPLDDLKVEMLSGEIDGSRQDLEEIVGRPVTAFAYPFGTYSSAVKDAVRRSYKMAFTTEDGLNNLGTDPFCLRRMVVRAKDSLLDFSWRVRVGFSVRESLRLRARKLMRGQ